MGNDCQDNECHMPSPEPEECLFQQGFPAAVPWIKAVFYSNGAQLKRSLIL